MEKSQTVGRCQESVLVKSTQHPGLMSLVWSAVEDGQAES